MADPQADALQRLRQAAASTAGLDVVGARVRRTSSRFCLGVEHGDYNGTELFGVGTDRFIWLAYKPNNTSTVRLLSVNVPEEGVVTFELGKEPPPRDPSFAYSWARFPYGVAYVLRHAGYALTRGFDAVLYGNIPGGGMSRSASLCVNLLLTLLEVNGLQVKEQFDVVTLCQRVENEYIGCPSGVLDQTMIYFAKANMGTHFNPQTRAISHVPLGGGAGEELRVVALDTGTVRHGLEKSTYTVRRAECEELVQLIRTKGLADIAALADVRDEATYERILAALQGTHPNHCARLKYIYHAQQRFAQMMAAWRAGDLPTLGAIFRADGLGLRDEYCISGPELETMCDIARTVPGVLGERMLGGGDKGAAGCLMVKEAEAALRAAVATAYPRSRPDYAGAAAVHVCKVVDGVAVLEELL